MGNTVSPPLLEFWLCTGHNFMHSFSESHFLYIFVLGKMLHIHLRCYKLVVFSSLSAFNDPQIQFVNVDETLLSQSIDLKLKTRKQKLLA